MVRLSLSLSLCLIRGLRIRQQPSARVAFQHRAVFAVEDGDAAFAPSVAWFLRGFGRAGDTVGDGFIC